MMRLLITDFNGADHYFNSAAAADWKEIQSVLRRMPTYLHGSQQEGKRGRPIFDPKASNRHITDHGKAKGWNTIPIPPALQHFGIDLDLGKNSTLVEVQFSNYPFLWNNITRAELFLRKKIMLPPMSTVGALIVVTKSGQFPSSNSTLYYEQANVQISDILGQGIFTIPIRLVGLSISPRRGRIRAMWSQYAGKGRTKRKVRTQVPTEYLVKRGSRAQYGQYPLTFTPAP